METKDIELENLLNKLLKNIYEYNKFSDTRLIKKAFFFGAEAHKGQYRQSGCEYFVHCVNVAILLSEKKMDDDSIITGLLHDTVEDTNVTIEDVRKKFGDTVATLVNGVTKLSHIKYIPEKRKQAENFRKLLLALSDDIRVLIIKLADRIHNMRTMNFIKKKEKQLRISSETLELYVPLSERVGIREWKEELEDISFYYLNFDAHTTISKRLNYILKDKVDNVLEDVIKELKNCMLENEIKCDISGRQKSSFSIWQKMQKKEISFEQLSDIIAFRVIVNDISECYKVLGVLHSVYRLIPGRFKDYISLPKPNGYKSLHTSIIGPSKQRIEVQIRTEKMHIEAEYGVAAHWIYKENNDNNLNYNKELKAKHNYRWIKQLIEILEQGQDVDEFMEHTRLQMFRDETFVFSPKGDLVSLPKNATPIDFAYSIHSEMGNKCKGAKVDGRMVPLRTVLSNGNQVEIITSATSSPSPDWENFVVSGKAKAHIRKYIRVQRREEFIKNGKEYLAAFSKQLKVNPKDSDLIIAAEKLSIGTLDDMYMSLGEGIRGVREILYVIYPELKNQDKKKSLTFKDKKQDIQNKIPIKGFFAGMEVTLPKCCHPLPGDEIIGLVNVGKSISVHKRKCKEVLKKDVDENKLMDISWDTRIIDDKYIGRIKVVTFNKPTALASITTLIESEKTGISNLKFANRGADFYDIIFDLEVKNSNELLNIIARLRSSNFVSSVRRL